MSTKTTNSLRPLIQAMSKSEKRYFKLHNTLHGKARDKRFIQLFDHLDNRHDSSGTSSSKSLDGISSAQVPNLQTHLYYRILQSLNRYHMSGNPQIALRESVNYIHILFEKGLYNHCWKLLRKTKKTAQKLQNHEMMLVLLKWEKMLHLNAPASDELAKVERLVDQVKFHSRIINNVNTFSNLASHLHALTLRSGYVRSDEEFNEAKNLIKSYGLPLNPDDLSFYEQMYFHQLKSSYHHFIHEFPESQGHAKRVVSLLEENPNMIPIELEAYVNALGALMKNQVRLNLITPLKSTMNKLEQIRMESIINETIRIKLINYRFVYRTHQFAMTGEFTKGTRWVQRHHRVFKYAEKRLDLHSRLTLYYQMGCLYFGASNFRESLKWMNKINQLPDQDIREDILSFSRIQHLICHYELGNLDIIESAIKSTYRFLLRKHDLYSYQKSILASLRRLSKADINEDLLEEFTRLRDQLQSLKSEKSYEQRAFFYFDIISWLESKIQGVPVEQVVQSKALRK